MSKFLQKFSLIIFVAVMFSGCGGAKKNFVALPPELITQIGSTDVYLEECEEKMTAEIENSHISTYSGGGLLFALADAVVEANRTNTAAKAMQSIQKELEVYELRKKFSDGAAHEFFAAKWLNVHNVNYMSKLDEKTTKSIVDRAKTDALLVGRFVYKLNPSLDVMNGTLYITLYPTGANIRSMLNVKNPLAKPIFKFHISATEELHHKSKKIEDNANAWAESGGMRLKTGLDNIIYKIFHDLRNTLKNPEHLPED
jgi:hypothetical protein